jgi:hypothetical protein
MMSEENQRCAAVTKAGARCKNPAQAGSDYCHVHRQLAKTAVVDGGDTAAQAARLEEVRQMVAELNQLAEEIQNRTPEYTPPPFTPQGLLRLLKENLHRFSPDVQLEIIRELQANLQDASAKDLLDPETWKGVWFILNYSLQNETASLRESLTNRLSSLPGVSAIAGLADMLKGSSPKDLLDLDTWKGMFFLVNYSVQHEAQALKERILGGGEDEDEG